MACGWLSSPCRGKSPAEWQFMHRGCCRTGSIASKAAAAAALRCTIPEVGLCCLSLGAALAVRKQLTTHSETAKMIGNITLWRFIYLSSVDAALKPLHSSGFAACECVSL